ncbi:MAG: hypothetical protein AB7G87_04990 [Clostridia bacterium]
MSTTKTAVSWETMEKVNLNELVKDFEVLYPMQGTNPCIDKIIGFFQCLFQEAQIKGKIKSTINGFEFKAVGIETSMVLDISNESNLAYALNDPNLKVFYKDENGNWEEVTLIKQDLSAMFYHVVTKKGKKVYSWTMTRPSCEILIRR